MTIHTGPRQRSRSVARAEYALWIWTGWALLCGLYQTRYAVANIEGQMGDIGLVMPLDPGAILAGMAAGYVIAAFSSAGIIWKIGAGKNWARLMLVAGFLLEVCWAAVPPYRLTEVVTDIPDLGLQSYAIYLLYSKPGTDWFAQT